MRVSVLFVVVLLACGESPTHSLPPRKAPPPAPPSKVRKLWFAERSSVAIQAGGTHQFRLTDADRPTEIPDKPARGIRIAWSVLPEDEYVAIDEKGIVTVDPSTQDGWTYEVIANVNRGNAS